MFKLEGVLNFHEPFPKSTVCERERSRATGCFVCKILNSDFFGIFWRAGGGRNVMKEFEPTNNGYLGLDGLCFPVCIFRDNCSTEKLKWKNANTKSERVEKEREIHVSQKYVDKPYEQTPLPYLVRWIASYFLQGAGLVLSHTSACTPSRSLHVHVGWNTITQAH